MAGKRRTVTFEIDVNGCHLCTSHAPDKHGYPHVWKNERGHNLHRILYEEKHRPLPKGILVRHICDVRRCINLDHLIPGTTKDNAQDRKERGRNNTAHGETRSDAKLNQEQVDFIKSHMLASQRELAELFGVNQSTISRIKRGLRWPYPKKNL